MMPRSDTSRWLKFVLLTMFTALIAGCSTFKSKPTADLKVIYERSAQYHKPDRNPIIVIPGILGSKLIDKASGRTVWGAFDPNSVDPTDPNDVQLISLPIDGDKPLQDLKDGVEPNGVLDKVHVELLGIPLDIRAYVGILSTLGVGGYRDEELGLGAIDYGDDHFTCFQFDYDWRRDNVENAKRLKAFIDEKKKYIQGVYRERYGIENADVKFDVVAHSMGGLVTRYFMRYGDADLPPSGEEPIVTWAGAADVDRVILVGTPSAGSLNAFTQLIDGYDVGRPILPFYQASLLGTFPSIYELLPRPRHNAIIWDDSGEAVDIYDPEIWERYNWGLASSSKRDLTFLEHVMPDEPDPIRRRATALALQSRILQRAKRFHAALDKPASPPSGVHLYLVAGDAEDTPQQVSIDRMAGEYQLVAEGPGDGTVLRSSALNDERISGDWSPTLQSPIEWESVMFLFANHLGLTQDEAFADNVLYWLLEDPRRQE